MSQHLPRPYPGVYFCKIDRRHVPAWLVRVPLRATLSRMDEDTINVEIDHATPGGAYRHENAAHGKNTARTFYAGRKRVSYKSLRAALPRDVEPPRGLKVGDSFDFEIETPIRASYWHQHGPAGTCVIDTQIREARGSDVDTAGCIAWIRRYGLTIEFPVPDEWRRNSAWNVHA